MTAVAALIASAKVDANLPVLIAAVPRTGVAFNIVVPIPETAAAFADIIFDAVPVTAPPIYKTKCVIR